MCSPRRSLGFAVARRTQALKGLIMSAQGAALGLRGPEKPKP